MNLKALNNDGSSQVFFLLIDKRGYPNKTMILGEKEKSKGKNKNEPFLLGT